MRGPGMPFNVMMAFHLRKANKSPLCHSAIISLFAIVILSVLGSLYKVRLPPDPLLVLLPLNRLFRLLFVADQESRLTGILTEGAPWIYRLRG
jgi:hypothetical protein